MKKILTITLLACAISISGCTKAPSNPQAEQAAIKAAQEWLTIVDAGQYGQSWDTAAEYFKNAVGKENWAQTAKSVRVPLGSLKSRSVQSSEYTTSAPGYPDGEYVIIQFESSFENKQSAVETVTPMKESDGTWKVSGYYIK